MSPETGSTGPRHLGEETLHDYVDGALAPAERREVEAHLEGCARCRAEVAGFRGLLEDLASLPAGIAPERDLLAGVEAGIEAREESGGEGRSGGVRRYPGGLRSALWAARVPLAAAAVVLVTVSSLVTAALLTGGSRGPGADEAIGPGVGAPAVDPRTASPDEELPGATAGYRAVDAQYAAAARELARTLEERRDELSPATIRLVEENLRVIDEALAEAREALAADPANPVLRQMVVATHERKLEFLRRAARVAGEEGDS